jgi:DNA gyrase subunit A
VRALNINDDDRLVGAILTEGDSEVILANSKGYAIRFAETTVRSMGRTATGVRGMRLSEGDEVIGMICMRAGTRDDVLVVSEQGMGKRSALEDYRVTNRGGKGVKTINITAKTGKLIAIKNVNDDNDLVIINKSGIAIRLRVSSLRVVGRATQGVRLINLEKKNDEIASVCKVDTEPETTDEESVRDAFQEEESPIQDVQEDQDVQDNDNENNEQPNENE